MGLGQGEGRLVDGAFLKGSFNFFKLNKNVCGKPLTPVQQHLQGGTSNNNFTILLHLVQNGGDSNSNTRILMRLISPALNAKILPVDQRSMDELG